MCVGSATHRAPLALPKESKGSAIIHQHGVVAWAVNGKLKFHLCPPRLSNNRSSSSTRLPEKDSVFYSARSFLKSNVFCSTGLSQQFCPLSQRKKTKKPKKKQKTVRDRKRVCGRPVASVAHCAPAALPEESNGLTLIHQCAVACLSSPLTQHTVWPLGLISTHSTGPQHGRG